MADYIYLLENRLSQAQREALLKVRDVVRAKGMTIFLVGGAVRDLTSGSPVRDLDVVVQGNALKLKKELEKAGAIVVGEQEPGQSLFLRFPGGVRMEFGSTLSATYPKPGKVVYKPAAILDDLRRRDFTANAMALSLNDGSYGLLMDPLNGVADIEQRQLRLVSNYGFIDDPVRMVRAARLQARLGWQLDDKTQRRYDNSKEEDHISALSAFARGYETEEIVHEEDPIRVMKRLEAEGWMVKLFPAWSVASANIPELEKLRAIQTQLQLQGLHPDPAAAHFPLLTAKMSAKDIAALKASFPRQGFVQEVEALDAEAKDFATLLTGKSAASPSQAWKAIHAARPEAVLWAAYSSKSASLQAKLKSFYAEWPQMRQRIPYTQMQEMRITPELPGYAALLDQLFYELLDGKLTTPEEIKAFLEPFSPPAPPPPVNLRRARASKKDAKPAKGRAKKSVAPDEEDDALAVDADTDDDAAPAPGLELEGDAAEIDLSLEILGDDSPADDEDAVDSSDDDADDAENANDESGEDEPEEKPVRAAKKSAPRAASASAAKTNAASTIRPKAAPVAAPAPAKKTAAKPAGVPAKQASRPVPSAPEKAPSAPVRPSAPAKKPAPKSAPPASKTVAKSAAPARKTSSTVAKSSGKQVKNSVAKTAPAKPKPVAAKAAVAKKAVPAKKAVKTPAKKVVAKAAARKAVPARKIVAKAAPAKANRKR